MSQPKYWMVHCVSGSGSPNVKHPTRHLAEKEARRLAFAAPNSYFTVLEVVDCYVKPSDGAQRVAITEPEPEF